MYVRKQVSELLFEILYTCMTCLLITSCELQTQCHHHVFTNKHMKGLILTLIHQ